MMGYKQGIRKLISDFEERKQLLSRNYEG